MQPPTKSIESILSARYGMAVSAIERQAGGQDGQASVLRVFTGNDSIVAATPTHIAKVRPLREGGLLGPDVARHLRSRGLPLIVAPVPTLDDATTVDGGDLLVTVYPFVDGVPGATAGLTDAQWTELGWFVRRLHDVELPPELAARLPVETFVPTGLEAMPELLARMRSLRSRGAPDALDSVIATWRTHDHRIADLVRRTDQLSASMRARSFPLVTCHADLHVFNVLVDADGALHVVDWDEVVRARRERDLMFFVGGGISEDWMPSRGTERFLAGYGEFTMDSEAVAYYRHAWAVQDISNYTLRVLDEPR